MQRKDLALRVLSTAAIMSIVTSIAAPAFADVYYIGNGSIDVKTMTGANGEYVQVTQNGKTYTDTSKEIVIKDGTSEKDATLKEAARAEGTQAKPAVAPAAGAATQELEAAGTADAAGPAAGESQLDPDDAFTLSEEEEDSEEGKDPTENPTENPTDNPTEKPTENPTDDPTANSKKDVVYQYDPADPDSEQQATKPTLSTSAAPTAETREATQANAPAADPAPTTPAEGSAENPTKNVIRVINNWVGDAAKELKIRLSNVNIKVDNTSRYASGGRDFYSDEWNNCYYRVSAAKVQGTGNTKIELDGQNVLDNSACEYWAGLNKKGNGNLTITDETSDTGETITAKEETETSGSLRAEAGWFGGAAIGGNIGQATDNITIKGYATVKANTLGSDGAGIGGGNGAKGSNITIQGHANVTANGGWSGAGIGGGGRGDGEDGCGGDAENITIQDYAKVTATAHDGAAIGSGSPQNSLLYTQEKSGVAKNIVICGHARVNAKSEGLGAAIGAAGNGKDASAEVTIGTPGATAETEDVHVTAIGHYGSAIGNGAKDTKVTIQGHVTIQTASDDSNSVIGSSRGNVEVNIKDNASIDPAPSAGISSDIAGGCDIGGGNLQGREVVVNIDGGKHGKVKIGENHAILGSIYGAISGTKVNIGDNVLLKMLQSGWSTDAKYINVNNVEAAVGTRSDDPTASGLVNTIGDNTELWYINNGDELQKIVHGKNLCKKSPKQNITKEPTCTESGSADCTCDYETTNGAAHPSCNRTWTDKVPALGHHWVDNDDSTHICDRDNVTTKAHSYGEWVVDTPATCTTAGQKKRTCTECGHVETQEIPATGHHWKDNGNGTHTCTNCGATEALPADTNSALELRVVDAEGINEPFTVSQNGTLRTYTGAYDIATLTGDLDTLRYLQDHGAQTIQFVTNGQTSSFAINDLLAQGSGSEVFYLTHRGAEEPTLLLVEADHSELVKD